MHKKAFVIAYTWMYGGTKKEAKEAYKHSDDDYKSAIIECYECNAQKEFYCD